MQTNPPTTHTAAKPTTKPKAWFIGKVKALMARKGQLFSKKPNVQAQTDAINLENVAIQAKIDAINLENVALQAEIDAMEREVAALKTSVPTLKEQRDLLEFQLRATQAEHNDLKRNQLTVIERIAQIGFPLDKLPGQIEANGQDDPVTIFNTWKSLTGGAKTLYFRQHQKVLESYKDTSS